MSQAGNFAAQHHTRGQGSGWGSGLGPRVRAQAGGQGSGPLACWLLQGGPCEAGVTLSTARGLTLSGRARLPGGVGPQPWGLWLGTLGFVCWGQPPPQHWCPQLRFWEGMEGNRIHSLFLSSSFKCEDGVQMQMPPLRGAWAQPAWAASYRWSPASEGACRGRGFLIWKGGAMVLTPWDCAGDKPPVLRQESV